MIKSLLHFNNPDDLTKDEGKELTWQVYRATADANGKFGSAINLNAGRRLVSDKKWNIIQTGDFTVDFWVNVHSGTADGAYISTRSSSGPNDAIEFRTYSGGILYVLLGFAGSATDWATDDTTGKIFVSPGTWHHVAVVRQNDDFYFFVDGKIIWNISHSGTLYVSSENNNITLGGYYSQSSVSLDEFRISDEALWTSEFEPPTHETSTRKFIYIDKNNIVMGMKE